MENLTNELSYRKAFMNHVLKGERISEEIKNEVGLTKTGDIQTVIPKVLVERIIERIHAQGMIINEVTRTSYKAGMNIPTSTLLPVASWVGEGEGSEKQKKTTGEIVFRWNKLRCAINVTLEVSVVSLDIFEQTFVRQVGEAMLRALEQAIVDGDGAGKPKGILHADNLKEVVAKGRDIAIAKGKKVSYDTLIGAEALLDIEYEDGAVYFMSKKQFLEYMNMTDSAGMPLCRVNYGLGGAVERTLLGRRVVLHNYMPTVGAEALGGRQVVAFLVNPKDYYLNTSYDLSVKRYEDNDTDDIIWKSVMLVDGQLAIKDSLVTISKAL